MAHGSIHTERMDPRTRGRKRYADDGSTWDRYAVDHVEPVTLADSIDRAHRAAAAGHAARGESLPTWLVSYGTDVDMIRNETRAARLARCDAADAADTDRT